MTKPTKPRAEAKGRSSVWIAELETPMQWAPEAVFLTKKAAEAWVKSVSFRWVYRLRRYIPAPRARRKR